MKGIKIFWSRIYRLVTLTIAVRWSLNEIHNAKLTRHGNVLMSYFTEEIFKILLCFLFSFKRIENQMIIDVIIPQGTYFPHNFSEKMAKGFYTWTIPRSGKTFELNFTSNLPWKL